MILATLLMAAASFRFYGLNWDQQIGAHPDERYIVGVASRLSFRTGLNPFDVDPNYAYGHLPLYLLALGRAAAPGIDPLLLGRALSAVLDVGTVALTFAVGREVYGRRVGLLGATVIGLTVAHVQQAHFYTPDTLLTFFVVASLFFAVHLSRGGRMVYARLAGASAGLALGAKATAGLLVIPLGLACLSSPQVDKRREAAWDCAMGAVLFFLMTNPFAFVESPTFLGNLAEQAAILRGAFDVPYTLQYRRTLPYVYPVLQQLRWGMGWLAGAVAILGLTLAAIRAARLRAPMEEWVLLSWTIPYFFFVGGLYAKFPRYLLPMVPLLGIYAARLIEELSRRRRVSFAALSLVLLTGLLLRCVALACMYRAPHPWATATDWFRERAAPGSVVAVEAWDHPLPLGGAEHGYALRELPVYDEEGAGKAEAMEEILNEADYVVLASRRGYASLGRWPDRFGRTLDYYDRLFGGELGFEPVACFYRYPRLGPLVFTDDPTVGLPFSLPDACRPPWGAFCYLGRLDESFVVYDHPRAVIFRAAE